MEGKWGDAVFDDDGILTFTDENGNPVRVDRQGRLVCNAHLLKDATKLCRAPIVGGMRVCRLRGGPSPQAKNAARVRLADLVDPAITTLALVMADKTAKDVDRLRAADSILDRAGVIRGQKITVDESVNILKARAIEIKERQMMEDDRG